MPFRRFWRNILNIKPSRRHSCSEIPEKLDILVIPAKAGIQSLLKRLDSDFRRNDDCCFKDFKIMNGRRGPIAEFVKKTHYIRLRIGMAKFTCIGKKVLTILPI
jgi:hypothetical protein